MDEKSFVPPPKWPRFGGTVVRFGISRFLVTIFATVSLLYVLKSHPQLAANFGDKPLLGASTAPSSIQIKPTTTPLLPWDKAEVLCAEHGMKPYPHRDKHRKVYDLFLVSTELDWTEIRLNELAPHVDYCVILEAEQTFTNLTKPKYFKKNWKHFSQFQSQIIYHVLNDDAVKGAWSWAREKYQRNAMLTQVFPSLLGEKAPNMGDVIIVSDVDEIPYPETVEKLRNCEFPERTGLLSRFFLYSFQLHRTDFEWFHPQATFWQGEKTILPESLRMEGQTYQFPSAAWHCTSCFPTVAEMITKVESFSHQEYDKTEFKDPDQIVRRVREGIDVFDRKEIPYERVEKADLDAPKYLLQHSERFAYLLDRDPKDANFVDYVPRGRKDEYDRSNVDEDQAPKIYNP